MNAPNSEIMRAIAIIDQRIESLTEIKRRLAEEFGLIGMNGRPAVTPQSDHQKGLFTGDPTAKPKKQVLIEFLQANGAMLRKDLIEKSGVKEGTLASLLNDKETFRQLPDKRWDVVEG